MAQYGGEQYMKQEGHKNNEYPHNPLHSTTGGHEVGATGNTIHSTTAGHDIGGTGTAVGTGAGHRYEEGKHGGTGGILHRSGSGSSSSSEDDGEGGRRKKTGVVEKLPGGDHGGVDHKTSATHATVGGGVGGGYGNDLAEEGHEKKGLMEKIKDKLPGSHQ